MTSRPTMPARNARGGTCGACIVPWDRYRNSNGRSRASGSTLRPRASSNSARATARCCCDWQRPWTLPGRTSTSRYSIGTTSSPRIPGSATATLVGASPCAARTRSTGRSSVTRPRSTSASRVSSCITSTTCTCGACWRESSVAATPSSPANRGAIALRTGARDSSACLAPTT
jgi:hypothetical protein